MEFPSVTVEETSQPLRKKFPPPPPSSSSSSAPPSGYLDLAGIWARLEDLCASHPSLLRLVNLTSFGPGKTHEGREMPVVKLSDNVAREEDEPNVLVLASHHAREIVNPHLVLDLLQRLLEGYAAGDQRIKAIVDNTQLYLTPLWNPDGYNHVWEVDNMWRKNRKPVGNTYGVDQNRNYIYGWSSSCSGSSIPSSETYKGEGPASEEETQIMIEWSRTMQFAKVQDYHSSGREVLHSFVCDPYPKSLDAYVTAEAKTLASKSLIKYATRYPSGDGQHQEFHLKESTSYAFLTETQTSFQPAFSEAQKEADALWPLNLHFLERPIPLSGHVVSEDGSPLAASISVAGLSNVSWKSNHLFGAYHVFLPDGFYNLTFSAPGYKSGFLEVEIDNAVHQHAKEVVLKK